MRIKSVLLIISGSVAAYKALELIRELKRNHIQVDAILTKGGQEFITPLMVSSLTGTETYTDLFSLKDEVEMGHIQLSRKADAILVAPASADTLAKMAQGQCADLATTTLLATNKPVFVAPAMNHHMWSHPATQRNIAQLIEDGVQLIAPSEGEMACGEYGVGRFADNDTIIAALNQSPLKLLENHQHQLTGKRVLVLAGPTHEMIDPVRYLGNLSSGKQGIAIAESLHHAGAEVNLILGSTPFRAMGVIDTQFVTSADEMFAATQAALPADVVICAAAIADWKVAALPDKMKKSNSGRNPVLHLTENPDILQWISQSATPRPSLVIGFAAETQNVLQNAADKLQRKQCDWLLANDVSNGQIFGADHTEIYVLPSKEHWVGSKKQIATNLTQKIIAYFEQSKTKVSA